MSEPAPARESPTSLRFRSTLRAAPRRIVRSVLLRVALFAVVLWGVAKNGQPWQLGWIRKDEAATIAESFLLNQGADVQSYTLIQAVERRPNGTWYAHRQEARFGVDPAVGYVLRYFRPGNVDGWTIAVSPTGQIYRVQREQPDDEPGARLPQSQALDLVMSKLAADLSLPATTLGVMANEMVGQPQRNDWIFTFSWPAVLDSGGTFTLTLAGEAISELSFPPRSSSLATTPARPPFNRRVLGFALILGGVFLIMHYHRTPLALKPAGIWGAVMFGLILAVRGLSLPQAVMMMPSDTSLSGYLSRVALGAVVEALQGALLLGLIIATGESLARDVLRRSTSLSRLAPETGSWRNAWAQAARWALPSAALIFLFEAAATYFLEPVGLCSKVPAMVANTLSSPIPPAALAAQMAQDVLWDEGLYRLWLLTLFLFWLRLPALAVPLSACAAAYFAGFDLPQLLSAGGIIYVLWNLASGWLFVRVGIVAAMLFHALVLAAHLAVVMIWTGFGALTGIGTLGALMLLILLMSRDTSAPVLKGASA